jgi:hypothetical protein
MLSSNGKSDENAFSSPTSSCSMSSGCDLLNFVNFGRDYHPQHFALIWIILHDNQFLSRSAPLCFVSVAVIFHGDQFRQRLLSMRICFNRD